ncbi:hypothetical protein C5167_019647 [Papaver somniferum]|uniref:Mitochondrial Rho GTPase n=1 Tax=Papaver somniferum TaxID=3469 RepID=A0A4Y7IUW1_PAPSO|nr:hypothetical protein C5167_019647 [Papaver somniferum]
MGKSNTGDISNVRVVVVGDPGTGKSSLISGAATYTFRRNVPPVLRPTRVPGFFLILFLMEDQITLAKELKLADAVVLTYACDAPATLDGLSTFWLLELRKLEVKVSVIVVGCKLDPRENKVNLKEVMSPIMQQFREIGTCIECSAHKFIQVQEVFHLAQKAVLHPKAPLFDQETQTLKPRFEGFKADIYSVKCFNFPLRRSEIAGVKRVVQDWFRDRQHSCIMFRGRNYDVVRRDALSDEKEQAVIDDLERKVKALTLQLAEMHHQQEPHHGPSLQRVEEMTGDEQKNFLGDKEEGFQGVAHDPRDSLESGLKLEIPSYLYKELHVFILEEKILINKKVVFFLESGFLFLHALFVEKGRAETTWMVLRKFGYDNEIKLRDDLIPLSFKRAPDQSVELTTEAVDYLKSIFNLFDLHGDGALRPAELDDLFSTAPESPWSEAPYKESTEKTALGGLSFDGFLAQWALMTLLDPVKSVASLIYIGYQGGIASVLRITRRRRLDCKKQQSDRNVIQCFVFGPKGAGKSSLLNSFVGRPSSEAYSPTTTECFATNTVDHLGGNKKTLILREIPEDGVKRLLSSKKSLADCDVAIFVYDSSDEKSWKRANELLVDEDTGFEVPCLIIEAKDDLDPFPLTIQNSTRVSQDMGIEAPIPVSMKLGDLSNVFRRIISAAEHPHLSIPETEARPRKQYRQFVNRSLPFVSVGAAVAIAYRVYAARKNTSS